MAFKNLEKQRPAATRVFTFDTLPDVPELVVRYGGKGTPGFRSDEVRLANANRHRSDQLTESSLDATLAEDAKLIAKHCVISWKNVVEDDGKPAPCTPEKVEEFLLTLIEHREDLFLGFRRFVRTAEFFVGAQPASSGTELGKS
jgi:hypothetical protein